MPIKRNFDLNEDHQRGMQAVLQEMELIGLLMVKAAVQYLADNKVDDERSLSRSINEQVELFMAGIGARLIVGTNSDHAEYVHDGTRPRKKFGRKPPPIEPLKAWAMRKLNIIDEAEAEQAARAIAWKIWHYGTEAKPFLDFAVRKYQDKFADRLQKAYLKGFA